MVDAHPHADQLADDRSAWALIAMLLAAWRRARRNRRTRWALSKLDDDRLRDVGISRASADREVRKSFPFHGNS